jgi:NAD(P)-dependent dehydrogenase (short-subunit alcohol dehydrogenase family)
MDRIALVTGAGSGIGRAAAVRLSQAGLRVVLAARGADALAATAAACPGPALAYPADVTDPAGDQARSALEARQPIGRLITPEEVAGAVWFCVASEAVTGQAINVDGGTVQS